MPDNKNWKDRYQSELSEAGATDESRKTNKLDQLLMSYVGRSSYVAFLFVWLFMIVKKLYPEFSFPDILHVEQIDEFVWKDNARTAECGWPVTLMNLQFCFYLAWLALYCFLWIRFRSFYAEGPGETGTVAAVSVVLLIIVPALAYFPTGIISDPAAVSCRGFAFAFFGPVFLVCQMALTDILFRTASTLYSHLRRFKA